MAKSRVQLWVWEGPEDLYRVAKPVPSTTEPLFFEENERSHNFYAIVPASWSEKQVRAWLVDHSPYIKECQADADDAAVPSL